MRKLLTLILILCTIAAFAEMRGGSQYDPGAARSNLSNVDAAATPSMTSITLSDKIRAVWADILGDIYASGTVKVSTGTAAAPAYSFASDPDTGMYSPGANSIGFSVGGTEYMRIPNTGNVLIGTSVDSGGEKFKIYGNTAGIYCTGVGTSAFNNTALSLRSLDTGRAVTLHFSDLITNDYFISHLSGGLYFGDPVNTDLSITPGGNVLIATSTDDGANKLQVNGTAKATSLYALGGNGNQLYLDNGGERYTQISFLNSGVQKSAIYYDNTNTALSFYTGGAERMALKDSGNVLIATSTDDGANKLQVNGFTKLGEAATGVKMKVLTGTTAATEGGATTIVHGLDITKVISFSATVINGTTKAIAMDSTPAIIGAGYLFSCFLNATNAIVDLSDSDSENILSKTVFITIWYKE